MTANQLGVEGLVVGGGGGTDGSPRSEELGEGARRFGLDSRRERIETSHGRGGRRCTPVQKDPKRGLCEQCARLGRQCDPMQMSGCLRLSDSPARPRKHRLRRRNQPSIDGWDPRTPPQLLHPRRDAQVEHRRTGAAGCQVEAALPTRHVRREGDGEGKAPIMAPIGSLDLLRRISADGGGESGARSGGGLLSAIDRKATEEFGKGAREARTRRQAAVSTAAIDEGARALSHITGAAPHEGSLARCL